MLDVNRSLALIKGALLDPDETWRSYLPDADDWTRTAALLTGPLIVGAALLSYLVGALSSGASVFGFRPTLTTTITGMLTAAIAAGLFSFIVSWLAGTFGGRQSFARGLAVFSLAFVPGYVGQVLGWLPWIGSLVALALFIYALVLLWRIIPVYLDVPDSRRAAHYISSLLLTIVVMMVLSFFLRPILQPGPGHFRGMPDVGSTAGGSGMMSNVMRQAEVMAAAEEDSYRPPADGRLEEDQLREFVRVMQRAGEIADERGNRLRELADRAENNESISMSDMTEMFAGASQTMGFNTIEMEVVQSFGGNWAEHQWVKETLRSAYLQRDLNPTSQHNYALYKKYEDDLAGFVNR